jgi:polysaccharide export outer membrane protein
MGRNMWRVVVVISLAVVCVWPAAVLAGTDQSEYVVGPTDVLSIAVYGESALTGKYTVGNDGELTFPLLGRVKAAGLTVRAIEAELRARLAEGFLKHPQVTVEVAEYRSQRVFVIGEVAKPGAIPLTGGTTLLEALAGAGALTDRAGGDLLLLRPSAPTRDSGPVLPGAPGVTEVRRVNIQDLQVGAVSDNSRLVNGDTIFVPRAETIDVIGQVNNPGQYAMEKGLSVLRAISMAGGVTRLGSVNRVKIIRIVDGKKTERSAKLDDRLQPGDTLVVQTRLF